MLVSRWGRQPIKKKWPTLNYYPINPVRNSRGVFRFPRELCQAVIRAAERRGIISNGINRRYYPVRGHRAFKRYFVALFILFSAYFFIYSSIFDINHIIISGNAAINAKTVEDMVDQIKKEKRWFIFPEKNILFFDDDFLKSELMNNISLDSVQIKKRPWGTLYVSISEKAIVALWLNRGRQYTLDKQGKIIDEISSVSNDQIDNFVKITNSSLIQETKIGERVISDHILETIININSKLPEQLGIKFNLFDINEVEQGKIVARTAKNFAVYFSTIADVVPELNKLITFVLEKDRIDHDWRDNTSYIDLRFGSTRIYYK